MPWESSNPKGFPRELLVIRGSGDRAEVANEQKLAYVRNEYVGTGLNERDRWVSQFRTDVHPPLCFARSLSRCANAKESTTKNIKSKNTKEKAPKRVRREGSQLANGIESFHEQRIN